MADNWPDMQFNGEWPAWIRVLAATHRSGWMTPLTKKGRPIPWTGRRAKNVREWIDKPEGTRVLLDSIVLEVRAMIELGGLPGAWWKSGQRFTGVELQIPEGSNPLVLDADELANLALPSSLYHDEDVLTVQAVASGLWGEWSNCLGTKLYYESFLRGMEKISTHPMVMVMVASPFIDHPSLVHISNEGMAANLWAVEGSLFRGCRMRPEEQAAWLRCGELEPALLKAVRYRNQYHRPRPSRDGSTNGHPFRFPHRGWFKPNWVPLPPPVGRKRRPVFNVVMLPMENP